MDARLSRAFFFGLVAFALLLGISRFLLGPKHLNYADAATLLLTLLFVGYQAFVWREAGRAASAELKRLSISDPLTNLYGAQHFLSMIDAEIDRDRRLQRPLSLLYIDIDYFTRYNQVHGLRRGDEVLAWVGALIAGSTRRYDSGFRFGHDEFTLILPETDRTAARQIAERLRDAFAAEWGTELGLSIGVVAYEDGDNADSLLRKVTSALAEARRRGGNRVRGYIERGMEG